MEEDTQVAESTMDSEPKSNDIEAANAEMAEASSLATSVDPLSHASKMNGQSSPSIHQASDEKSESLSSHTVKMESHCSLMDLTSKDEEGSSVKDATESADSEIVISTMQRIIKVESEQQSSDASSLIKEKPEPLIVEKRPLMRIERGTLYDGSSLRCSVDFASVIEESAKQQSDENTKVVSFEIPLPRNQSRLEYRKIARGIFAGLSSIPIMRELMNPSHSLKARLDDDDERLKKHFCWSVQQFRVISQYLFKGDENECLNDTEKEMQQFIQADNSEEEWLQIDEPLNTDSFRRNGFPFEGSERFTCEMHILFELMAVWANSESGILRRVFAELCAVCGLMSVDMASLKFFDARCLFDYTQLTPRLRAEVETVKMKHVYPHNQQSIRTHWLFSQSALFSKAHATVLFFMTFFRFALQWSDDSPEFLMVNESKLAVDLMIMTSGLDSSKCDESVLSHMVWKCVRELRDCCNHESSSNWSIWSAVKSNIQRWSLYGLDGSMDLSRKGSSVWQTLCKLQGSQECDIRRDFESIESPLLRIVLLSNLIDFVVHSSWKVRRYMSMAPIHLFFEHLRFKKDWIIAIFDHSFKHPDFETLSKNRFNFEMNHLCDEILLIYSDKNGSDFEHLLRIMNDSWKNKIDPIWANIPRYHRRRGQLQDCIATGFAALPLLYHYSLFEPTMTLVLSLLCQHRFKECLVAVNVAEECSIAEYLLNRDNSSQCSSSSSSSSSDTRSMLPPLNASDGSPFRLDSLDVEMETTHGDPTTAATIVHNDSSVALSSEKSIKDDVSNDQTDQKQLSNKIDDSVEMRLTRLRNTFLQRGQVTELIRGLCYFHLKRYSECIWDLSTLNRILVDSFFDERVSVDPSTKQALLLAALTENFSDLKVGQPSQSEKHKSDHTVTSKGSLALPSGTFAQMVFRRGIAKFKIGRVNESIADLSESLDSIDTQIREVKQILKCMKAVETERECSEYESRYLKCSLADSSRHGSKSQGRFVPDCRDVLGSDLALMMDVRCSFMRPSVLASSDLIPSSNWTGISHINDASMNREVSLATLISSDLLKTQLVLIKLNRLRFFASFNRGLVFSAHHFHNRALKDFDDCCQLANKDADRRVMRVFDFTSSSDISAVVSVHCAKSQTESFLGSSLYRSPMTVKLANQHMCRALHSCDMAVDLFSKWMSNVDRVSMAPLKETEHLKKTYKIDPSLNSSLSNGFRLVRDRSLILKYDLMSQSCMIDWFVPFDMRVQLLIKRIQGVLKPLLNHRDSFMEKKNNSNDDHSNTNLQNDDEQPSNEPESHSAKKKGLNVNPDSLMKITSDMWKRMDSMDRQTLVWCATTIKGDLLMCLRLLRDKISMDHFRKKHPSQAPLHPRYAIIDLPPSRTINPTSTLDTNELTHYYRRKTQEWARFKQYVASILVLAAQQSVGSPTESQSGGRAYHMTVDSKPDSLSRSQTDIHIDATVRSERLLKWLDSIPETSLLDSSNFETPSSNLNRKDSRHDQIQQTIAESPTPEPRLLCKPFPRFIRSKSEKRQSVSLSAGSPVSGLSREELNFRYAHCIANAAESYRCGRREILIVALLWDGTPVVCKVWYEMKFARLLHYFADRFDVHPRRLQCRFQSDLMLMDWSLDRLKVVHGDVVQILHDSQRVRYSLPNPATLFTSALQMAQSDELYADQTHLIGLVAPKLRDAGLSAAPASTADHQSLSPLIRLSRSSAISEAKEVPTTLNTQPSRQSQSPSPLTIRGNASQPDSHSQGSGSAIWQQLSGIKQPSVVDFTSEKNEIYLRIVPFQWIGKVSVWRARVTQKFRTHMDAYAKQHRITKEHLMFFIDDLELLETNTPKDYELRNGQEVCVKVVKRSWLPSTVMKMKSQRLWFFPHEEKIENLSHLLHSKDQMAVGLIYEDKILCSICVHRQTKVKQILDSLNRKIAHGGCYFMRRHKPLELIDSSSQRKHHSLQSKSKELTNTWLYINNSELTCEELKLQHGDTLLLKLWKHQQFPMNASVDRLREVHLIDLCKTITFEVTLTVALERKKRWLESLSPTSRGSGRISNHSNDSSTNSNSSSDDHSKASQMASVDFEALRKLDNGYTICVREYQTFEASFRELQRMFGSHYGPRLFLTLGDSLLCPTMTIAETFICCGKGQLTLGLQPNPQSPSLAPSESPRTSSFRASTSPGSGLGGATTTTLSQTRRKRSLSAALESETGSPSASFPRRSLRGSIYEPSQKLRRTGDVRSVESSLSARSNSNSGVGYPNSSSQSGRRRYSSPSHRREKKHAIPRLNAVITVRDVDAVFDIERVDSRVPFAFQFGSVSRENNVFRGFKWMKCTVPKTRLDHSVNEDTVVVPIPRNSPLGVSISPSVEPEQPESKNKDDTDRDSVMTPSVADTAEDQKTIEDDTTPAGTNSSSVGDSNTSEDAGCSVPVPPLMELPTDSSDSNGNGQSNTNHTSDDTETSSAMSAAVSNVEDESSKTRHVTIHERPSSMDSSTIADADQAIPLQQSSKKKRKQIAGCYRRVWIGMDPNDSYNTGNESDLESEKIQGDSQEQKHEDSDDELLNNKVSKQHSEKECALVDGLHAYLDGVVAVAKNGRSCIKSMLYLHKYLTSEATEGDLKFNRSIIRLSVDDFLDEVESRQRDDEKHCDYCSFETTTRQNLGMHGLSHVAVFSLTCKQCSSFFYLSRSGWFRCVCKKFAFNAQTYRAMVRTLDSF